MNKRIKFISLILCIAYFVPTNEIAFASSNDTPPSIEEMFTQVGYKSVEEAVKEFENHFEQDVKLPKNDFLSIHFVNEKSHENNYKVDIRLKQTGTLVEKGMAN
ncbi:hypothetical protein [Neobacillus vireti]|uniref:hypothetical protein n=1 Tax=Neobacillus vireti TaxID=220686 RepID=UPI002FFED124